MAIQYIMSIDFGIFMLYLFNGGGVS